MNQFTLPLVTEELPRQDLGRRISPGRARYIGSKARVADAIMEIVGHPSDQHSRLVDLFCGSGAVSRSAAHRGWRVHANDHLTSSVAVTAAQLLDSSSVNFAPLGGYEETIKFLNQARPIQGPIYSEYTPSGKSRSGHRRMYFTEDNGAKIDGVRAAIFSLEKSGIIGSNEKALLIADLISGVNSVANIAGTYGCYLSRWTSNASNALQLRTRELHPKLPLCSTSEVDAFEFVDQETDVLYCDPPYTKRQYAAYYHLLETVALGDFPEVDGVAGIRPWHAKSSPFCYKRKVLWAFGELLKSKRARTAFISYSSEGHSSIIELTEQLGHFGKVTVHCVKTIARYTPNTVSRSNGTDVIEYLIELRR